MKKRTLLSGLTAATLLVALAAAGPIGLGRPSGHRSAAATAHRDGDRGERFEVKDPDKDAKPGMITPAQQAYVDRAYPRGYIPAAAVRKATHATRALPVKLTRADFRAGTPHIAARSSVGADWEFIGPQTPFAPGATTESLKDSITSGRVTALAVDPNCGSPDHGCRLWMAAAGGGIWRTDDAEAAPPTWTAVDEGLPTNAFGSLVVDPTDPSGDTLYAGTGEANAINQAGLGLYKTTDGGDHWSLVEGSYAVSHDRSIGAVRVDPTDADTIWIGTADGRQGQSSVNGGSVPPPGAPPLGVYVSHDGGASFDLAFSLPDGITPGQEEDGGVTDIALDPTAPDKVYAAFLDGGVWRTAAADELGDSDWKQVYAPTGAIFDRTEVAITVKSAKTRVYVADGGFDADFNPTGELFRVDDADVPASDLVGLGSDNSGWTKLSSSADGDPGFAAHQLCQSQCDYDLFLEVDPTNPDTVWFGGSMVYEEIRPLQDQSLAGIATWRSNGRAVMRSEDAGVHFTDMTADTEGTLQPGEHQYEQMHPDQHAIAFDPTNTDIAFVGSDGGMVRTDGTWDDMSAECDDPAREITTEADATQKATDLVDCHQWLSKVPHRIVNMNDGLGDLQFVQLSVDPANALGDLLGGTQDNGTFSYSATLTPERSWFESVNGDGAASGFDVGDSDIRYHTYFLGLGDINHHGSDPSGWTFITQPILESGEAVSFYTPVILDPKVPGTIFLAAQHVWRTKDDGGDQADLEANCASPGGVPQYTGNITCGDFEPIGANLTSSSGSKGGSYLAAVERAPSDTSTLWVASRRGRLFISKNADAKPESVSFNRIDTDAQPQRFISGVAVDPADPNHAYVSFSGYDAATPGQPGHVFDVHYNPATSTATWTNLDADLPDQPITDVAFDDYTGDLYAATDYAVLRRPSGATTWEQAANGLPLASVPGITLRTDGRVLYAATYGRAAWRLSLGPGARITGPDSLAVGQTAVYDGTQSRAFGGAPLTYTWTLPDGSHASGPTVAYHATSAGSQTLGLLVTAPDGRQATTSKTVTVTPSGGPAGFAFINLETRRAHLRPNGTYRFVLSCPAANALGCVGAVHAKVLVAGRHRGIGSATLVIGRGGQVRVKLRMSRSVRDALGGRTRVTATLKIRQLDSTGVVHKERLPLTIVLRR
ncbi:MAG: PKD domain-containing protein [Propionibacteriales bacterium]|nr:PKD domain-containing protein [Propionibacteriales bacterium]